MFSNIWTKTERTIVYILTGMWLLANGFFWMYWFKAGHVGTMTGFVLSTITIFWVVLLSGHYLYFLLRMKKFNGSKSEIAHLKVAMVVTKAPSEPFSVIKKTLKGMLSQEYPHDTWVADEDPTPEAMAWYKENGVKVSCRKDDARYHNEKWPRRKKCKEGNLAYFYEQYGYEGYDVVIQLDADHVPEEGYLLAMLKPFADETVGYVAAADICDNNKHTSWASRARIQSSALFHGPIQSGTNDGFAPVCIGSHYALRTKALKQVGGLGPELAEDYSTTLLLNAEGWRGVWAHDAVARGEGPNSFDDIIVQDYQWARSLTVLLISLLPKLWKKLSAKLKFQFVFRNLYYPIGALVWFTTVFIPVSALLSGVSPVNVNFVVFLAHLLPLFVIEFVIYGFTLYKGHLRPSDVKYISWENMLFELARWPWVLIACIDAVYSNITGINHTFKVTSKGKASSTLASYKIAFPYVVLALVMFLAILFRADGGEFLGYYYFALVSLLAYIVLTFIVIVLHIQESVGSRKFDAARRHAPHFITSFFLIIAFTLSGVMNQSIETSRKAFAGGFDEFISTTTDAFKEDGEKVVTTAVIGSDGEIVETYEVVEGDTLRGISEKYYGDERFWHDLIIETENPDLIFPGDKVKIKVAKKKTVN